MKLQPESRDIDLYVSNRKVSEKELKELAAFIKEYKAKHPRSKSKRKKSVYSSKPKTSIAAEPESGYASGSVKKNKKSEHKGKPKKKP